MALQEGLSKFLKGRFCVIYLLLLVFCVFWVYNHALWTKCDPTIDDEQAMFDAFGIYTFAKVMHQEHIHPLKVGQTLWGFLGYYVYEVGIKVFGERLSSVREVLAFFSGVWAVLIYLIFYISTKRPIMSFFITLIFIPFSTHINFHANRGYAHFYNFLLQDLSLLMMLLYARRKRILFLVLTGLIQGVAFGFKYEFSMLGLFAAFLTLYVLEAMETSRNTVREKSQAKPEGGYAAFRFFKIAILCFILLGTFQLVRMGFLSQIFFVFWASCLVLLVFEAKLTAGVLKGAIKPTGAGRSFFLKAAVLLGAFVLCVILWFLHMWAMTDLATAKNFFMQIANTSNQVTRMSYSSSTFGVKQFSFFWRMHRISFIQLLVWGIGAAAFSMAFMRLRNTIVRGIIIGALIIVVFAALSVPHLKIASIYYFMAAISVLLWLFFAKAIKESNAKGIPLEFAVFLCFLSAGSLSLLRETSSVDLNVWAVFPGLIGVLAFMTYSPFFIRRVGWLKAFGFTALFYFAFLNWVKTEWMNFVYCGPQSPGFKNAGKEFDLYMPVKTSYDLIMMRVFLKTNVRGGEYIFVFNDHSYPYILSPTGFVTKPLITFQMPDEEQEKRMLNLFKSKNIKYVLYSEGIPAYNSDRASLFFHDLSSYIEKNYMNTGLRFLNFSIWENKETLKAARKK